LDLALLSGNGGQQVQPEAYRAPDLLLNWGPSLDSDNVDMLSRIFAGVDTLTGTTTGGSEFLDALVSEDWDSLPVWKAENAYWSGSCFHDAESQGSLNFLALENGNPLSEDYQDLMLLVVNDSPDTIFDEQSETDGSWIVFWTCPAEDWTGECCGGFEADLDGPDCDDPEYDPIVSANFDSMPPFSASLIRFVHD
ncbi:hypothetical protein JW921_03195, partial [Candidatus Fermentibacterales bacterium]|nr:hypothetical protein [Candidatus Fermentibacterales bacterium]